MPDKCCIVGCKTNYIDGPKNSVFYFPQDEKLKKKWIRFVNRKNWTPTKHSVICAEHFSHKKKSLLEWSSSPLPSIYLTKNSSLPPPPPSVLSTVVPAPVRKPPTNRSVKEDEIQRFMKEDLCIHINNFTEKHCPSGFSFNKLEESVVYYRLDFRNGIMKVKDLICISIDLKVTYEGMLIPLPEWLRTAKSCKITRVSQLLNLPSYIQNRLDELPPSEILDEVRSLTSLKPQGRPPYSPKVIRYILLLRYSSRQAYSLLLNEIPLPSFSLLEKLSR